jgi:hypothetical protein
MPAGGRLTRENAVATFALGLVIAWLPLWLLHINLNMPSAVIPPGEVKDCKLDPAGLRVTLTDGRSLSLNIFEVNPALESKPLEWRCLPAGTLIERRSADLGMRLNGARPAYFWHIITGFGIAGSWIVGFCALALVQRLRGREGTLSFFRVMLMLAASVLVVGGLSARLHGLQRHELIAACVAVGVVAAIAGSAYRVPD